MAKPEDETPNVPTVNDTDVQDNLPPADEGKVETQTGEGQETYMVTLGSDVFSVKARNSVEAGKKARKLYDEKQKENK